MRIADRRRILPVMLAGVAALVLAACGSSQAGAAATLGDSRVTETELTAYVQESLEAQGKPVDSPDAALLSKSLTQILRARLVNEAANRAGIVITQGMMDQTLQSVALQQGTSVDGLYASLAAQGFSKDQVAELVRVNLEAQEIGKALDPTGSAETQNAALLAALGVLGDELDITTNPRYGTWDNAQLSVGPSVDDVATLPTGNATAAG